MSDLDDLLACQAGVVSRAQLVDLGVSRVGARHDAPSARPDAALPGVYVDHTGRLTREQRAIAAVLYAGRAALHLASALDHPRGTGVVHVAIDASRRVRPQPGMRVHRVRTWRTRCCGTSSRPGCAPRSLRWSRHTARATDIDAIAALTAVVGSRAHQGRSTRSGAGGPGPDPAPRPAAPRWCPTSPPARTRSSSTGSSPAWSGRTPSRSRRRGRPPGRGARGRSTATRSTSSSVSSSSWTVGGTTTSTAADRDSDRDLDDLAGGRITVRLRYRQVFDTGCRTAVRLGGLFRSGGGRAHRLPCSPGCDVVA